MLESELAQRCKSFVADKGLDTDELRKIFYRYEVTTAIDVRRMWQEQAIDGIRYPTRSLHEGCVDTMINDEVGTLNCKCPQSGKVRQMSYYWLESKRGTQKFHCPVSGTGEECHRLGGVRQDAKRRIVRIKINEEIAPLRRCQSTPVDGRGITKDAVHWSASMPGSVATFSWSITICEDLKPSDPGCPESVGDAGDGLYVDPRGSPAANQIADSATGSLRAAKQSTRQCLAAGSWRGLNSQKRSHQRD